MKMKLFEAYYLLIFFSLRVASQEPSDYAKPGCYDTCGKVKIPYPFGIGAECAVNQWYVVYCNYTSSKPYLGAPNYRFEIGGFSLENQTVTVLTPKPIYSCPNDSTRMNPIDLGGSPFLLSPPDNIFVFEGCGSATMTMDNYEITFVTSCSTKTCPQYGNNCSLGINCCQNTIPPHYLHSFNITIDLQKQGSESGCEYAFVMETSSYNNRKYYEYMRDHLQYPLPISLLWTLSEADYDHVNCSCGLGRAKLRVPVMGNNGTTTLVDTWKCRSHLSYSGSSYLEDGCHETTVTQYNVCSKCTDKGLDCDDNNTIYNIDGSVNEDHHKCKRKSFMVIFGLGNQGNPRPNA